MLILTASLAPARHAPAAAECGTDRTHQSVERFLHKQSRVRRVAESGTIRSLAMPSASNNYDVDGIAVIDDADGVVNRRNPFSLGQQTIRFTPVAAGYRIETSGAAYDAVAATRLNGLGDDDSRKIDLPFSFPFFGTSYKQVFVNSDGNLTFTMGDTATSDRSVSRFNAGPPRIAPLFTDLDPSRAGAAVTLQTEDSRVVVT